ncbi:hypothetical protein SAMN05660766_1045 [Curtobacterium sp. 314Chir4.1]|jgi:hypothetical protein|uniref:hypothetical protein n=1 Tax=Curtobacterium sp. 314Chir4.1 TaxID=1279028 RepID=UPI000BC38FDD|nr:hypothetical protein [Curtobacterium sp. 314Chir4.1]SOC87373.1 hypothetical protein SAMN05660766_1045 [Curtobacterium sp. 314Chir4.1]
MATAAPKGGVLDAAELARRLNLLLDFEEAQRGSPVPFSAVEEYVAEQGGSLSRAKWTYMLSGDGRRNRDTGLLRLLAGFFEVDERFLLEDSDVPERIGAQLALVRSLRSARVSGFAARTFPGELSPDALRRIAEVLEEESQRGSVA